MSGLRDMRRALDKAQSRQDKAAAAAMYEIQSRVIAEAQLRAPVDLGPLRASGVTLPPVRVGPTTTVIAGFGGAAAEYAIPQHERLDYSHTVGEAKYLERPFLEMRPKMGAMMAVAMRRALRRLG